MAIGTLAIVVVVSSVAAAASVTRVVSVARNSRFRLVAGTDPVVWVTATAVVLSNARSVFFYGPL